jgi:hypothetical protein
MKRLIIFALFTAAVNLIGCSPSSPATNNTPYVLSYGDSVIYLHPTAGDYVIYPLSHRDGVYSAFPEGIEIDERSGAINVSKSETGLRYRITHTATDGTQTLTTVMLSGITFPDKFYNLSLHDSLALPVYNGNPATAIPLSGSSFDEGNIANGGGCSVQTDNGVINLAQCVRNGVFGTIPQDDSRRDFEISYRINDASGRSLNKIKVRIYYYSSMAAVAADLLQTLSDRQSAGVFLRGESSQQAAKPRPPCVIIIAN